MKYDWRCQACDSPVKAGNDNCPACGCPAIAKVDEIENFKKAYLNSEAAREKSRFRRAKCDHHEFATGSFRASGGGFSEIFDVATENFKYVSCKRCGYTEFYKTELSMTAFVADVVLGH